MECRQIDNKAHCTCSKTNCSYHGMCCECIQRHKASRTMPSCVFHGVDAPNRSFDTFAEFVRDGKM